MSSQNLLPEKSIAYFEKLMTTVSVTSAEDNEDRPTLPPSISFSPAGLLYFAYHLGVASVLETMLKKMDDPQSIELIGCSAGALCATTLKLQIPYEQLLSLIVEIGRRKVADYK